jgi:tetratricopeptide (TPR) repeat protein
MTSYEDLSTGRAGDFTKRTPHIIGRKDEIERLNRYLHTGDERQVVYYWAKGGLGKTRLLEELQEMIVKENQRRGGFHTTGIIDLYHTDTHSTSDIERIIVRRLDPDNRYFCDYRRARRRYEVLRERGTDPKTLEDYRKELAGHFTQGYRDMSVDARKIVLCFDTIELLQYESSVVEEKAGLDTSDTRLKPWLLEKLSNLPRALIVFAGRPKLPPPDEEQRDPQVRLLEDMRAAFGDEFKNVELKPFTLEETRSFIEILTKDARQAPEGALNLEMEIEGDVIPEAYLPIIHRLTGGRPIFLHLVFDLIWNLSVAPREVLDLFGEYQDLADAPEDDPRLDDAREAMQRRILGTIFNETGLLGEYLKRIALLPKGVDVEILSASLGLPKDEAQGLLDTLDPLSFIKHFKPLPGSEQIHPERTFLHDELYRLLTSEIVPYRRIPERQVASAVIKSFYDPEIAALRKTMDASKPEQRVDLRERLQKFQVESLYYLLVSDVREGYKAYKTLTEEANHHRWVGFGMRLLDEFLRFYNASERRPLFEIAGISHEQVIRESAELWCERFTWWEQRNREIQFSEAIMANPHDFSLVPKLHAAIWGNIHALWGEARGVLYGYESHVVERLQGALDMLPPIEECDTAELLARARLTNAIGFQFGRGGRLAYSVRWYSRSKAAYTKLGSDVDPEGFTSLLNNLAFGYAKQGRMTLARTVGHEALRINEETSNRYMTGLTLSTLSSIALLRGNYAKAIGYGEEALTLFQELEDTHGTLLAHLDLAEARRKQAKHELEKGRTAKLPEIEHQLLVAQSILEKAIELAETAEMESHLVNLYAEQGCLYRDLGRLRKKFEGIEAALPVFHNGSRALDRALESDQISGAGRVDILEDLGEVRFLSGDVEGAMECIKEAEALIPDAYRIEIEETDGETIEQEYYASLAKLEMLRGQMAFEEQGAFEGVLQHYLLADIYFKRFSPEAIERDKLVEYVYRRLRRLSIDDQRALLSYVGDWLADHDLTERARDFLDTIHALLGI